ncbi:MAG: acetolactate synthase large subunit [Helicobacteraceae bacterium]
MQNNGSLMIVEAFKEEGVEVVFGYPGGAVLNIYDEIYKQHYFRHIMARHEQGAVHSADGYARSSGKTGVAIVTSGPGFTNAITGIATAYTDSIPLVIISGQVPMAMIGTDAFQEIDAVGISRSCTKHNYLVKSVKDLPRVLKEAFYVAKTGRPGPVLVDIPKDISAAVGEFNYLQTIEMQTYKPHTKANYRQLVKVAELIKDAKKPLFYLGGGVVLSGAADVFRALSAQTAIPAVETLMARGVLPFNNESLLGMVGMHGSYAANMAMSEADLIIALGARFDDRVTAKLEEFARAATIIHIDIDPSNIGKIVKAHLHIVADLKDALDGLLGLLSDYDAAKIASWLEKLHNYSSVYPLSYENTGAGAPLKPQFVIEQTAKILGENAIVVTDVGQHQMWAAQFFPFMRARQFITSGGFGTMGFGFSAALGAKVANPHAPVVNFTGDGSILMNSQEMMTAVAEGIPVINVILNNNYLGMVRQWQTLFYESRFSSTVLDAQPDFIKLAQSYGGVGYKVLTAQDLSSALEDALRQNKPCFIDVAVDRNENVLPMVPVGGTLYNMILDDKEGRGSS